MDKDKIIKYLYELDNKLGERGLSGSINIYGGSCLALVYDLRGSTKDIDAIFSPKNEMYKIAEEIAIENNLPSDWLNDGVKGFVTSSMEYKEYDIANFKNLKIFYPTAETMLAMKLISMRSGSSDIDDIKGLIKIVGVNNTEDLISIIEKYYSPKIISLKTYYFIDEMFANEVDEKESLLDELKELKKEAERKKDNYKTDRGEDNEIER